MKWVTVAVKHKVYSGLSTAEPPQLVSGSIAVSDVGQASILASKIDIGQPSSLIMTTAQGPLGFKDHSQALTVAEAMAALTKAGLAVKSITSQIKANEIPECIVMMTVDGYGKSMSVLSEISAWAFPAGVKL